jgi:hypothetical protein
MNQLVEATASTADVTEALDLLPKYKLATLPLEEASSIPIL